MKKENSLSIPMGDDGRLAADSPASALERWLAQKLYEYAGSPPLRLVLWSGDEVGADGNGDLRLHIRDRAAFYKLLADPALHFGDLYSIGRLEVEDDLVAFLEHVYTGVAETNEQNWLKRVHTLVRRDPRANTLTGSRANIHHHYDLGNRFYELWLDREMQYTCAYFPDPAMTLEQAQLAKMEHVCRKLRLKPGDRVVEAGCGWGGLARYMARAHGVTVRAYNISHEQVGYACERAKREGLDGRVEYVEDDYRNMGGEYDAFVSVGMLEHVGTAHYAELGEVIHRVLTPSGRGLIHSIGRNRPELMNSWIERRIFPGAYPPTLREMMGIFEPRAFSVLDVENLRLHYALTLKHWLERYERHAEQIARMYDEAFVRAWRLYLAGSMTAFTASSLQLFQVVFTRARNNELAWSRAHLYE